VKRLLPLLCALWCLPQISAAAGYDTLCRLDGAEPAELAAGRVTSEGLADIYRARIAALNGRIHAVIGLNPQAPAEAAASDARRDAGRARGPLDGLPILVKDNIDIAGLPTTAGSLALAENVRSTSATVVQNVVRAGAVILGRTNLSEWANIRSQHSSSGWSAVGGLTLNPYMLDRTACGSSSGSAAAVAAGMAAAAIGTETDGSIGCPSSMNGLVGLKPTVGLVSRAGIVPISHTQDTAGPIARTVRNVAILLTAMAGTDPADPATADANAHRSDYTAALNRHALAGVRLGVARFFLKNFTPETLGVFNRALAVLRAQGATLVDVDDYDMRKLGKNENLVLLTELKADLNSYLAGSPPAVKSRTLADLIAFDDVHPQEMRWFGPAGPGVHRGAGRQPAARRTGRDRSAVARASGHRADLAHPESGLGDRPGERRFGRRRRQQPTGGRRLSVHHRADGRGPRAAGGTFLHRAEVVRGAAVGTRLWLRAGEPRRP
jgi:amidase